MAATITQIIVEGLPLSTPIYTRDVIPVHRPVTFLHGLNGSGKTTVLRLLSALVGGNCRALFHHPFTSMTVEYGEGRSVSIRQQSGHDRAMSYRICSPEGEQSGTFGKSEDCIALQTAVREIQPVYTVDASSGWSEAVKSSRALAQRGETHRLQEVCDVVNSLLGGREYVQATDSGYVRKSFYSTGEFRLLCMVHEVAIAAPEGSLILVDGPENGLHIVTQKHLRNQLLDLASARGCSIMFATHSPYVIGEADDFMVRLGPLPEHDASTDEHLSEEPS